MNIQSVAKTVYAGQTEAVTKISQSMTAQMADQTQSSAAAGLGADRFDISKPAEFLSKMAQLQSTDPAKFHETMRQSSGQLRLAAVSMQSQAVSQMLSSFASQFDEAAEGGGLASESEDTSLYSQLQNPLTQYTQQEQDQNSLSSLLAGIQPQLKANPKLQELFNKIVNAVDSAGTASEE